MRLSFLGNSYEASAPSVETTTTESTGVFLGNSFKLKQHNVSHRSQSAPLKYRGIDYSA